MNPNDDLPRDNDGSKSADLAKLRYYSDIVMVRILVTYSIKAFAYLLIKNCYKQINTFQLELGIFFQFMLFLSIPSIPQISYKRHNKRNQQKIPKVTCHSITHDTVTGSLV